MLLIFTYLFHFLLWLGLMHWIWRWQKDHPYRPHFWLALGVKVLCGWFLGAIYLWYYDGGDTWQYFYEAGKLAQWAQEDPVTFFCSWWGEVEVPISLQAALVYIDRPRALFFSYILSIFSLFTGHQYIIISGYLSTLSFLGSWWLARTLCRRFPGYKRLFPLVFFYMPSLVFWSSGMLKESLAWMCIAMLIAGALKLEKGIKKGQKQSFLRYFIPFFGLTFLLWKLKYYYVIVLLPCLLAVLGIYYLRYRYQVKSPVFLAFFGGFLLFFAVGCGSFLHPNLHLWDLPQVIVANHELTILHSGHESLLVAPGITGSWRSLLVHLPEALGGALFRPWIFEGKDVLQGIAGLERLLLLSGIIASFFLFFRQKRVFSWWVWGCLIYCISLAVLLAWSTPNLGTLSRYRIAYDPFLMILVFCLPVRFLRRKITPHFAS